MVLNFIIAPKLTKISFRGPLRKIAFASGGVSIVSWYSAFLFGMLRNSPADFPSLVTSYALLLGIAIAGSQLLERSYRK